jgi:putative ABC transport system ATP-binding protein
LIVLRDVTKIYAMDGNPVHALRGVSLRVARSEYIAIQGPSGSGKSTLMHILGCLDTPTAGTYQLDGVSVGELSRNRLSEIRNRRVGFVFQNFHLLPRSTAAENVELPLVFSKASPDRRRQTAMRLLERVGLGHRLGHLPNQLSGGERQRVAIARALANSPDLVLADEPTGNLDSAAGDEVMALFEDLHAEGRTVVVVTHEAGIAARAKRIIRLLDGRVVEDSRGVAALTPPERLPEI